MEREAIKKALAELKKEKKRNFVQSYDLIINLKNIDIKSHPLEFFITLPHPPKKKIKVACFAGPELVDQATKFCDLVIKESELSQYGKKEGKKLAKEYNYFIAQANLMPKIAQILGRILAPRGKMPNPKVGGVVSPGANLEPLIKKLRATVKFSAKKGKNLQGSIGQENQPEEEIIDNILAVCQTIIEQLPQEKYNLKNIQLKLTMSKPVKINLFKSKEKKKQTK